MTEEQRKRQRDRATYKGGEGEPGRQTEIEEQRNRQRDRATYKDQADRQKERNRGKDRGVEQAAAGDGKCIRFAI